MSMPFYVSPEQVMQDRADYARKGIARGRSVVVTEYDAGVLFVTENPSRAQHKVSEIYDRIGSPAVGEYNEVENSRVAGLRYAELRGYADDRPDVTARALANAYAQTLGTVFTTEAKPLEVEIVVAEVGAESGSDQIYRISYDGSVVEERGWVVIGGKADELSAAVGKLWNAQMTLAEGLDLALQVLSLGENGSTAGNLEHLEVAILDRARDRRTFSRLSAAQCAELRAESDSSE